MLRRVIAHLRPLQRQNLALKSLFSSEAEEKVSEELFNISDIKAPIELHGTAGKYATALYNAATRGNELKEVEEEIDQLLTYSKKNPEFVSMLSDPFEPLDKRVENIQNLLKEVESSRYIINLFSLMAENGRMEEADQIMEAFRSLMKAHRKEVSAIVTSAEPLKDDEFKDIEEACQSMLNPDEKLTLDKKVDPSIIGGLTLEIEDEYIDMSVPKYIQDIEEVLMKAFK